MSKIISVFLVFLTFVTIVSALVVSGESTSAFERPRVYRPQDLFIPERGCVPDSITGSAYRRGRLASCLWKVDR